MKLVLNVPTLERLIGGDTEIEVELRKQIVHEFSKRHLGEVAKHMAVDLVSIQRELRDQVLAEWGVKKINYEHFAISAELRQVIKQAVIHALHVEVTKLTQEVWTTMLPDIETRIKQCYDRELIRLVQEQTKADIRRALFDDGKV